jgi:hypothetical protein
MAAKFNCGQCGKRHRPGECQMENDPGKGKRSRRRQPRSDQEEKPLCFPHKWTWSPYTRVNQVMHERHQYCSKCQELKPGSRDVSRHKFSFGVCKLCGEWVFKNV